MNEIKDFKTSKRNYVYMVEVDENKSKPVPAISREQLEQYKENVKKYRKPEKEKKDKVTSFIRRRFSKDCDWINGNCFYFATILHRRFPKGKIYYDVIDGHFVFKYKDKYYDWTGEVHPDGKLVKWNSFDKYDELQKKRIIRDCIK